MKILFLGLGGIGQRHLRNLLQLIPDAEIGAVRHSARVFEIGPDLQANPHINIEEKYHIQRFSNLEDAVGWSPDFAVVSTPTSAHIPTTIQLVKNNIPVFLEKPISHNHDGVEELVQLSNIHQIPVMVGFMLRFHPSVQRMLEWVHKRVLGRLLSVQFISSTFMPAWHPYEKYNEFYAGDKSLGGGVILTNLIHQFDLLYHMFGCPKRLWCTGGICSSFDINVEDTVSALVEYEQEGKPLPVSIIGSFVQRPIELTFSLWGQKGKISLDLVRDEVVLLDEEQNLKEYFKPQQFNQNQLFVEEMKHFIDCISSGNSPITSLQEVIGSHHIALKFKESLEQSTLIQF